MATIKARRGPEANLGNITLDDGEFAITTDTKKLYVGIAGSKICLGGASSLGDMLKSVYDTNNDGIVDNADKLDGLNSTDFARAYSSNYSFGGTQTAITTADFVTLLTSLGAFNQPYWVSRGSWSYASNKYISDTGLGNIHLAGCTVEVIGSVGAYTIRIHTSTTSMSGVVNSDYIYVNNGNDYSPGWRKLWNSSNDGSGSGLDADMLDGKHASDFSPSGYGLGTNGKDVSGSDLNALQTTGFYIGSSCANAPNNGWFSFIVISHTDINWTTQYAVSYGASNTANIMYTRTKVNGNWGSWATVYSTNNKPTALDVGLGNVTNDSQVKRSEMGVASGVATLDSSGVNNQAPKAHTHDDRYYTETESDTKFAPSGFGLGVPLSGVTISDSNTTTTTGMYYSLPTDTHKPAGVNDGALFVLAYNSTWVNQLYLDWRTNKTYRRMCTNGTWSAWSELLTTQQGITWNDLKGV